MRETPTKVKRSTIELVKYLRKHNVKLDMNGEVDFSDISIPNVKTQLIKKESLVRLILLQSQLEFEFPQKLENFKVKADILKQLEEEENKVKLIVDEKKAVCNILFIMLG